MKHTTEELKTLLSCYRRASRYIIKNKITGICGVLFEMYAEESELLSIEEYDLIKPHFITSTKNHKKDGRSYYFPIGEKVRRLKLIQSLIIDIKKELTSRQTTS